MVLILLFIGVIFLYFTTIYSQFTFYKAELTINDNIIEEKLYYSPNKPYHTLYRNFETSIYSDEFIQVSAVQSKYANYSTHLSSYIAILNVTCSAGTAYYKDRLGMISIIGSYPKKLEYTSSNEYGCGFGNVLGFEKGKEYIITAKYQLNPNTLIRYKDNYYIKFVAYSSKKHPLLYPPTLKINGEATYPKYFISSSDAIIYIPYTPKNVENYKIINVSQLEHNNTLILIIYLLIALCPAIIVIIIWNIFGKENVEKDYPEELSQYPKERKAWEVSIYFHPPFGNLDENFMPAMILDFYNRKLIDIQVRKTGLIVKTDEVFIKILETNIILDAVELEFMNFLKNIKTLSNTKDGYFSIKKESTELVTSMSVKINYAELKKNIKEKSKEYIEYSGVWALYITLLVTMMVLVLVSGGTAYNSSININDYKIYTFVIVAVLAYVTKRSSLFIKFKKEYYNEYQEWQGFKNYLSHLDSIPRTSYKGVIMWEKYLVYATCLGVGKEVLKEMQKLNIINKQHYNTMSAVYVSSAFGTTNSGKSGGGGMGGGGMGGGGGGGR